MRILLAQSRWDDAADSAHRALETDDTNAEALATLALCAAAKDGRTGEAARYAAMVADGLAKAEPRYAKLMSTASSAFARMSTHDEELLDAARRLAEMAQRAGGGAGAVAAMAFCEAAAGNVQKALAMYDRAVDEDATAVGAILGSVRCLLALGRAEEAGMKADGLIESFRR